MKPGMIGLVRLASPLVESQQAVTSKAATGRGDHSKSSSGTREEQAMRPSWGLAAALSLAVSACLVQPGLAAASPARTQGVPTPGYGSELSAVGCGSAGQCWAVGNYVTRTQAPQNEILRWTGHGWQLATVPLPRGQSG